MIHSISQIQEGILGCDGSCRDFNLISADRVAVSELVAWFYKRFQNISANGNDGLERSSESVLETIIGLSKSSYIQIVGEGSNFIIDKFQILLCVTESGDIDVEITIFPQDIDAKSFDLDRFLGLINSWRTMANADEGDLRYENASWVHADTSRGSGVIYVSKST